MGKSAVITTAVIGVFIALFYFVLNDDIPVAPKPPNKLPAGKNHAIYEEITNKLNNIADATDAKNKVMVQKAIEDINTGINQGFNRAEANIPHAVDRLAGFKGCAKLSYYIASDAANGGSDTDKFINEILGHYIIEPSLSGAKESQTVIERLNEQLAKNYTDMTVEMASTSRLIIQERGYKQQGNIEDFIKTLNSIPEKSTKIATSTICSVIGIALEGIFIKSTVASAKKVLGSIASKASKTVLSSSIAAAADGPLPIGDIIGVVLAVGGAAWTAYDLYEAQYVMKNEVTATLQNAIREYRHKTLADFENEVRRIADEYGELNRKTAKDLIAML